MNQNAAHVAWVTSWYPRPDNPWDGSFFREQVQVLREAGMKVGVIAARARSAWQVSGSALTWDELERVVRAEIPLIPHGIVPGDEAIIREFARRSAKIYERQWGIPDVIHAHSMFPAVIVADELSKLWSVPFGLTEHRPSTLTLNPRSFRFRALQAAMRRAQFLVTVSQGMAHHLTRHFQAGQFGVARLIATTPFFEAPLAPIPARQGRFTFIHVSHADENKRVELTMRAFGEALRQLDALTGLPPVYLRIVGGDPDRVQQLRDMATKLGVVERVEFCGIATREDVLAQMNQSDAFVMLSATEAGGVVFLEALALGLPCIASATAGGRQSLTDSHSGILVAVDDQSAAARAFVEMAQRFASSQVDRQYLRDQVYQTASPAAFVRRHRQLYADAIALGASPSPAGASAGSRQSGPRVGLVSRIFMPEAAAASFRLESAARALVNRGAQLRVVTATYKDATEYDAKAKWRTVRVPALRDQDGYIKGYLPYLSFDLQACWQVLTHRRPQVLLVEPPPTTGLLIRMAAGLRRIPYVWYGADVWSEATASTGAHPVVVSAVRFMESATVRGAAGIIAVNEGVADHLRQLGATRTRVIPNGADTDTFNPEVPPLSASELEAAGVRGTFFVYAGTASQWQGAEIFAQALELVWQQRRDVQIVFLGRGTSADALAAASTQLRQRYPDADREPIVSLGAVEPSQAARWQAGAQAALVSIRPGLGYDFAYPTKTLTALACATPVIYAGAGPAQADIKAANLGWSVGYDANEVAAAMVSALDHHQDGSPLRQWVLEHRSMRAAGEAVAAFVLECGGVESTDADCAG